MELQSAAVNRWQPYLEPVVVGSCADLGSAGSCSAGCGFPLVHLKAKSKGWILQLALESVPEELNWSMQGRFSPSAADVILMRFSVLHNRFMILLYEKQINKTKHHLVLFSFLILSSARLVGTDLVLRRSSSPQALLSHCWAL